MWEFVVGGYKIFFDVKLYDIDNIIEKVVCNVVWMGMIFMIVYVYLKIMCVVFKGFEGEGNLNLCILGVIVLMFMDENDLVVVGYKGLIVDVVEV